MQKHKRKQRQDSEKCSIINRTVSFNVEDPIQKKMLEYTDSWVNFSGSMKRLITQDMSKVIVETAQVQSLVNFTKPVFIVENEVEVSDYEQIDELFGG